jgi:selenophosphate synthase
MYDPQTSGGLFIAAAAEHAQAVDHALMRAGIAAVAIGTAAAPGDRLLELT